MKWVSVFTNEGLWLIVINCNNNAPKARTSFMTQDILGNINSGASSHFNGQLARVEPPMKVNNEPEIIRYVFKTLEFFMTLFF